MQKKFTVRTLTYSALLIALEVVLSRFCSINTAGWKIGFSFVPIVAAAALFGPAIAAVVYGLSDLIGAILFPIGPYFPGFTVCAALMGFVYGFFLYRGKPEEVPGGSMTLQKLEPKVKFLHILIPALINHVLVGLCINTVWVSILYGSKTYFGWFLYRLPEYAILIPMTLLLTPPILRLCAELRKHMVQHP